MGLFDKIKKMKRIKLILTVCLGVLLTSCGGSLNEAAHEQLGTLSAMAELGTVEYTITKIIKANDSRFYTVGDRKILFSCRATMKAGIDLEEFSAEDVVIDNAKKAVVVTLPQPKVLAFNMPAEEAKLEYEKVSALRFNFTAEERNNLLTQGEEAILADAPNLGILDDARKNARMFFEALLSQVGFKTVTVNFKENETKKEE